MTIGPGNRNHTADNQMAPEISGGNPTITVFALEAMTFGKSPLPHSATATMTLISPSTPYTWWKSFSRETRAALLATQRQPAHA